MKLCFPEIDVRIDLPDPEGTADDFERMFYENHRFLDDIATTLIDRGIELKTGDAFAFTATLDDGTEIFDGWFGGELEWNYFAWI